ncbi:two-component system response regulator YesN [Gracilibacillus halotolerans]|uniref:Two-component system response regulator YesN n=1 Tax=Gracilibacillus halotolerans TaxID=74386 RepID=A0A841RPH4_9BACI|nr:response regulator [Gracilibacillus halotolerans]MBB6513767.1 two-component system response regulator YesN [Gracilibacillus halotolerans]
MFKVLLVDDERMILDGISSIVEWHKLETELIGKAMNGLEALELMDKNTPDIVITDITMPGLDGIGLVAKAKEKYPNVKWIFLSGYSEFDYAQQAMRYGVKHYLLKPCNEEQISEAILEVIKEIKKEQAAEEYIHLIEEKATKSTMLQFENMLKQYFMYQNLSKDTVQAMKEMTKQNYRNSFAFLLFTVEEEKEFNKINEFSLLIEKSLKEFHPLTVVIENHIVGFARYSDELIEQSRLFHKAHNKTLSFSIVLSEQKRDGEERLSLHQLLDQLFYQSKQSFLPPTEWVEFQTSSSNMLPVEEIVIHLKKRQSIEALNCVKKVCHQMAENTVTPKLAKGYLIQLFLLLMSKFPHREVEDRLQVVSQMEQFIHIESFVIYFEQLFDRLIHHGKEERKLSPVVQDMLDYIEEEFGNPDLSLQWLASNRLFMNADYLGKIFKKEMGQRFSTFVTNYRIDKAVEIAEKEQDIKVFELAERIGFGNNPQYFSQLFKRIKGFTPSQIIQPN